MYFQSRKEAHMTELRQPSFRLFTGRRSFLTQSGGAVLSATAVAVLAGREGLAAGTSTISDVSILNTMLGSEYEAVAAYQVCTDIVILESPVLELAVEFQGQHKAHADFLVKTVKRLGGRPVVPIQTA